MSVYMTEEEQLAAIKKWWNKHSNTITVVLSSLLLVVAAFKYWTWHQEKVTSQASAVYERLMLTFSNQDDQGIQAYIKQLIKDYRKTVYADAARLTLAKVSILSENYDLAAQNLEYVAVHSKVLALKQVARLRMVRLLIAKKAYDKALSELAVIDDPAYRPMINELKGDIYSLTGHDQQAILAYKDAMTEVRTNGMGNLFLEMKTNDLLAKTQSMKTNDTGIKAA